MHGKVESLYTTQIGNVLFVNIYLLIGYFRNNVSQTFATFGFLVFLKDLRLFGSKDIFATLPALLDFLRLWISRYSRQSQVDIIPGQAQCIHIGNADVTCETGKSEVIDLSFGEAMTTQFRIQDKAFPPEICRNLH